MTTSHNSPQKPAIAVIGGGAAGYFAAITAAEANPSASVTLFEQSKRTLQKVKISGGGRCNVTHHCFDPRELATRYPRGARELRAAFHRWQPQDTVDWFARRGVPLKVEPDGRMFPTTDDSQTIIDCFQSAAKAAGVDLRKACGLKEFTKSGERFTLLLTDDTQLAADRLLIAVGSLKASPLARALEAHGHTIAPLAPSLFAFNLADKRTHDLAGLSVQNATVSLVASELAQAPGQNNPQPQTGPILITHRGLSGPAILRLSAWQARALKEAKYHFDIEVNWLNDVAEHSLREQFNRLRKGKTLVKTKVFEQIPRRLWERLVSTVGIKDTTKWSQLPKEKENALIKEMLAGKYRVQGKTTNKDEFVTAGGIHLKEIDFRTMESKIVSGLHFAGECIDYDGVTGGFNFQGAWTTARLAGIAMAKNCRM